VDRGRGSRPDDADADVANETTDEPAMDAALTEVAPGRTSGASVVADPRALEPAALTSGVDDAALDATGLFARLVERQLDGSYRLAAVILGDALEAEEAVHDAAVAAWAGFRGLRDPERFDAWFGRILVNGCRDRLRRRKRTAIVNVSALIDLVRDEGPAADFAALHADRDAVARALAQLDPEHQVALVLRYWLDLPVDAIAERLAIPPGTVKSRLHNGLRRLRTTLDDGGRR
jgi:RNA polymerase sigma factor (sigma-70 family)